MKILLFLTTLFLSIHSFASISVINKTSANYHNQKNIWPHFKNPFKEKQLYAKGHGTMGLIAGLTLGPIGYFAAHIFSHNQTIRDKAKTGFAIWLAVVVVGVLIWQGIEAKITLDDTLNFFAQIIIQGIFSL